jgi:hypothetical protein
MANPSTKNVAAAKPPVGGAIYWAIAGTALPTTAVAVLNAAFKGLGYVADDGLVPTRDTNVEKPKAWGGDTIAALLTDESSSFQFTLVEAFQQAVNEFVYGTGNVTWTAAVPGTSPSKFTALDKGGKPNQCVFVFDMISGSKKMRIVIPLADPVITGERPYVDSDVSGYEVTVEALKDTSGVRAYRYFENDDQ